MEQLVQQKCVACDRNSPHVTAEEIEALKPQIPDWEIVQHDGITRLEKVFHFPDFIEARNFTNHVADLAVAEGHHPALLTEWGRVTVMWWTFAIKGLHRNDFIMAAKTDQILVGV
jgi:4a-hydroxytetrahydrobiopterin dehydratase